MWNWDYVEQRVGGGWIKGQLLVESEKSINSWLITLDARTTENTHHTSRYFWSQEKCQNQSNHVDCIILKKKKKREIHVCCSVQHSDLREVLMTLPAWRGLLTNEQNDSEKQQLMCGRKTCTSRKDDCSLTRRGRMVQPWKLWLFHFTTDDPLSQSFNKQPALETLVLSNL